VFDDVIKHGRTMSDPSFLVSCPTTSDSSLAPKDRHIYYVLFPTPNLEAAIDWSIESARYRNTVIRVMEQRGYVGFGGAITNEHVINPLYWEDRGMAAGSPFASAHSFFQTGPFRPGNQWGENVVFAGSGTTPGVGVPMVLISGRLAAERITGPDHAYRSRAYG
jgi:phytoene desaturase